MDDGIVSAIEHAASYKARICWWMLTG